MKRMIRCICIIVCTTYTCAYENLALRKPAWQKNDYSQSQPWGADKAVDGNYTDRGSLGDQCTISADKQQTAEWRVDLQSVVSISYINIFYRTDNKPGSYAKRFAGFYVYVSNTTSKEDGILCFHELQTVSGTPLEDQRINCSVYGRYVIYYNERLNNVVYPSYYSQYAFSELCEVEVYGCPIPGYYGKYCNQTCPVTCHGQQCDAVTGNCFSGCLPGYQGPHCTYLNLALGRPAWQNHNWPDKQVEWGAAKAVDGKYSDRGAIGGQCTISGPGQSTAEWRVDLEKIVSISHIHIYYRTDNFASPGAHYDRFAGFYVYISNDTNKDNGRICFHELQQVNGTPLENQKIYCPYDGRYVIYYNERRRPEVTYPSYYSQYAYNDLCELEVYGCPGSKYYGQNCDQSCPENCLEQRCNISTGNCFECYPGYKEHNCSQDCDSGMYGENCGRRCGHCLDDEQCDHVNECEGGKYGYNCNESCGHCINNTQCKHGNGTCPEGCAVGYDGPHCANVCRQSYWGVNCKERCSTECVSQTCHHETGHCIPSLQSQSCDTCKIDYTITITSVTVSILIVLMGSALNFYIWRKIQQKGTVLDTNNEKEYYNEFSAVDKGDKQSGRNVVTSPYAELRELDHQNTYEELHQYEKAGGKM
ncbi:uncharacterized protein LOC134270415 [Saccostrea cucullata]|uniref:uncharacterized protein LOC134270415 n=1 Tax=Saccostrea cuccullata TaxID=36930 RepID=UPI002ED2C9B0